MRLCFLLTLALLTIARPGASAESRSTAKKSTPPSPKSSAQIEREIDPFATPPFVPDSTVIARVAGRTLRVRQFRERYFNTTPKDRTTRDSTGRLEYLRAMIDKEVMGLTALDANRPLTFEDRVKMRTNTATVLGNVLYQRLVLDSVKVSDQEVTELLRQFRYEQRLRSFEVRDRKTAERVRNDMIKGRIRWSDAVRRYAKVPPKNPDGEHGWVNRTKLSGEFAIRAFELPPGGSPAVIRDAVRTYIVQCLERRPSQTMSRVFEWRLAGRDLNDAKKWPLLDQFYQRVRAFAGVEYDSTNIRWAADKFREAIEARGPLPAGTVDLVGITPTFASQDTARVLARIRNRAFTLGQFMRDFESTSAMLRGDVTDLESFIIALDGPAFVAERHELALSLGLDQDPLAVSQIERQREVLLVDHLFQDSVANHITVTPEMRHAYYEQRKKEFVSIPRVRYARFIRMDRPAAESLIERLKNGEVHAIMRADSLAGDDTTGAIQELAQTEPDEYRKILFEELNPGQSATFGPDKEGKFLILHVLEYHPERPMAFDEVVNIVDESVQNLEAERILQAFLDRRRTLYPIEAHPELVQHIRLTDPWDDELDRFHRDLAEGSPSPSPN